MNTKEKLLEAFQQFRPHINGHRTAMNLFFEAIEEVEKLQEQVKNCSIPIVAGQSEQLKAFIRWNNQHNGIASPVPEKMADRYLESL